MFPGTFSAGADHKWIQLRFFVSRFRRIGNIVASNAAPPVLPGLAALEGTGSPALEGSETELLATSTVTKYRLF